MKFLIKELTKRTAACYPKTYHYKIWSNIFQIFSFDYSTCWKDQQYIQKYNSKQMWAKQKICKEKNTAQQAKYYLKPASISLKSSQYFNQFLTTFYDDTFKSNIYK